MRQIFNERDWADIHNAMNEAIQRQDGPWRIGRPGWYMASTCAVWRPATLPVDASTAPQGATGLTYAQAVRYILDAKAWIAEQDERGFGPREVAAMQPSVGAHTPASRPACEGETIANAIRWHR